MRCCIRWKKSSGMTLLPSIDRCVLLHSASGKNNAGSRKGRIINIASASVNGNIGQANYSAAKAGVVGLSKTAAKELARKGVTVNAICPGFIETEMTKGIPQKAWDIMVSKIPMGYVGKPVEVANLVSFCQRRGIIYHR